MTESKRKKERNVRSIILENALLFEGMITMNLASILGINHEESRTLGHKSSSISLKTKTDFLIDIGALNKEDQKKIMYALEIRNIFMHNISCRSFEDFAKFNPSTYNALVKLYKPKHGLTVNKQLNFCYNMLVKDVTDITFGTFEHVQKVISKDNESKTYKKGFSLIDESMKYALNSKNLENETSILDDVTNKQLQIVIAAIHELFRKKFLELFDN